jgi:hypothetical protein
MLSCDGESFHRVASRGSSPALEAALPPPGPTPGVLFVDQHRVGEAKFADRGGDLRDLLVRSEYETSTLTAIKAHG